MPIKYSKKCLIDGINYKQLVAFIWCAPIFLKSAFTLGDKDFNVESLNTMLVI
jgi:hypothetical protein